MDKLIKKVSKNILTVANKIFYTVKNKKKAKFKL